MSWTTIYIRGRTGFEEEVIERLEDKWMNGSAEIGHGLIMFWMKELSELRGLKKAIGSRTILKYRLHFYTDLDEYIKSTSDRDKGFTESEAAIIHSMATGNYKVTYGEMAGLA